MKTRGRSIAYLKYPGFLNFGRLMKLICILLLFGTMNVYAGGFTQDRVTLNFESADLKKVLNEIQKKTTFRFLYNQALISNKPRVNLHVINEEVPSVLNILFEGTGIGYKILDNKLVVLKASEDGAIDVKDIRINGKVTGTSGEALQGVTVSVKGTQVGTTTDASGNYSISVPEGANTLVFSYVGYETKEVPIAGQTSINVSLAVSKTTLEEVVVIGYGVAAKRDLTGSIAKISGKEVADRPNTNPVASLQGKVAGLSVVPYGTPGKEPDIRIRGTISIFNTKPLYVVDGIFNDNIDYLNPNDIESIEVLKDPSSLAIFGVRGAGGVIAITTKMAKAGQVLVNVNSSFGFKKLVDKIKVLTNAADFKMLYEEEKANIGATTPFDYTPWTGNTDWIDAVTQTGYFNTNNISVTASTDRNKFYMAAGYTSDEGIVRHEQLQKIMLSMNDEFKVNKAFSLGFNFSGSRSKLPYDATWALADARRIAPIVEAGTKPYKTLLYGHDSSIYNLYSALPTIQNTLANPLLQLENNWNKYIGRENRMVGSVFAEVRFLRNFNFRTTLYADLSNVDNTTYNPLYAAYDPTNTTNPVYVVNPITKVSSEQARWNKYQQDYILTYKKNFGPHGLTATGGWTTYYFGENHLYGNVSQSLIGDPIPDDKRFWYISNGFGDQTTQKSSSYQREYATTSLLFRALYNYKNKYYLNGSFRRDGSSLIYNPKTRYQDFWAVGAAWELTREDFMNNQKFFNFLKLKGSVGVLGNQLAGGGIDYPYFPTLVGGSSAVFGNYIFPAYTLLYSVQPDLKWETVHAKEVGIEFNALTNRLHGEFSYYNKLTKDLLAFLKNGPNNTLGNFGTVANKGFEFLASWSQSLSKDLNFNVSANLTTYSNKVKKFGTFLPASEQTPNQTEVGYPIGHFFGYVVEGVYQSYADKLKSPKVIGYEYGPGDLKYKDINGDGVINTEDRTDIGNPTPDFTYGGSAGLNYKGFDFTVDFNGSYGNEVYRIWGSSELPYSRYNYAAFKLNRWHGEGTSNWVPILGDNHALNRLPSTFGIEDGSFFRLRNIQLGYNFSTSLLSKSSIKSARIFVNAQNLKTWKHNSGYTPEFGGSPTYFGIDNGDGPVPFVLTGGINVTF